MDHQNRNNSSIPLNIPVAYDRFTNLEKHQKLMLNDWFENTWKMREFPVEQHRHGMLMAWTLLSFIGYITTGHRSDDDWVEAFLVSPDLEQIYNQVLEQKKSLLRMYAKRFAEVWPVFSSRCLMNKKIPASAAVTRVEIVQEYGQNPSLESVPSEWIANLGAKELPLPEWQDILPAWQMVVLNLLDPDGWHPTEVDLRIVTNAFMSLVYFFKEGKVFFENPSLRPDIFDRTQVLSSL